MSLDAIDDDLTRRHISALNAKLDRYLAKHDAKEGPDEEIHSIFEQFGDDDRGDDVSSRWLQKSPGDAYANLARGSYLVGKAGRMRGEQSVADTPQTNLENMNALLDRAVPLLQKSVASIHGWCRRTSS